MTQKPLELFVDTNLFFECKKLEELAWSDLNADEIILMVTKPILGEIDQHKKGGGRTKKRALEVYGRVREMIKAGVSDDEILPGNPKVIFRLAQGLKFDTGLDNDLDKSKADDWLVGALSARLKEDPSANACLFTHDSGPASTAAGLGLPHRLIDDDWLRSPEEGLEEKRIKALERDLETYRAQEPHILIALDGYETQPKSITVTQTFYRPLTDNEVEKLMAELRQRCPEVTDFEETTKALQAISNADDVRIDPPSNEAIAQYRDTDYPAWLAKCRATFEAIHEALEAPEERVALTYVMNNEGSRPATSVRVSFRAEGDLWFYRYAEDDKDSEDAAKTSKPLPTLAKPPTAPRPSTVFKRPEAVLERINPATMKAAQELMASHKGALDAISRLQGASPLLELAGSTLSPLRAANPALRALDIESSRPRLDSLMPHIPPRHNPEGFYYDHWPSALPVRAGVLTCDLWRHQSDDEYFDIEVQFGKDGAMTGAVVCEVHAENLTMPATHLLRLERILAEQCPYVQAMSMIENLANARNASNRRAGAVHV